MKNRTLVIVMVVLAVLVGVLAIRSYDQKKNDTQAVEVQATVEQPDTSLAEASQKAAEEAGAAVRVEAEKLQAKCLELKDIYNKMTPYQKTLAEEPVCDIAQVQ